MKVRCINTNNEPCLTLNRVYEVESEEKEHFFLKGVDYLYDKNLFELVEKDSITMKTYIIDCVKSPYIREVQADFFRIENDTLMFYNYDEDDEGKVFVCGYPLVNVVEFKVKEEE